jgi:hypothetical protein
MTERKSRKQNRPDKKKPTDRPGKPPEPAGQEADSSPVVRAAEEPVVRADDTLPAQPTGSFQSPDREDQWGQPFPGGLNQSTVESAPHGTGLPEGSNSSAAPLAFPGWSNSWQASTAGSSLAIAFPGGNNSIEDRLPEQVLAVPFPGGLNPSVQDASTSSSPAVLAENTAESESPRASNDAQTQDTVAATPPKSAQSSTGGKRSKQRKK